MPELRGKVALITGASSGIGAGTATHFSSLGCYVALNGRNIENLTKVSADCVASGLSQDKIFIVPGDVSKEDDAKHIMKRTIEHFGKLDILINNAGIIHSGSLEETSLEDLERVMRVNVYSLFHMTQLAIPHLVQSKGNIVNISSIAGSRSFPGISAYCMSKAAVDQLTKTTALELASRQVRVNSVNPGVIVTDIHKRAGMSEEKYKNFLEHSKTTHALGRVGTTEEVAKTIAFLASEDASFITGQCLAIDGGRGIMTPR